MTPAKLTARPHGTGHLPAVFMLLSGRLSTLPPYPSALRGGPESSFTFHSGNSLMTRSRSSPTKRSSIRQEVQ